MKADAEWSAIEAKVHGNDSDYKVDRGTLLITQAARCYTRAFGSLLMHDNIVLTDMVLFACVLPGIDSPLLHCHHGE